MEQLTLEQAAGNHSRRACVTHVELNRSAQEIDNIAFQAGAEWLKEQYKELITHVICATQELDLCGAVDLSQKIIAQLKKLELLQD